MPLGPDPARAQEARAGLAALRDVAAEGEDDVLAALAVTGEPAAQRVLDDWLDQVADTLRALGEAAGELGLALTGAAPPLADPTTPVPTSPGEVER
ncbi:hypothetical protein [uncultured Phycicoccus sp.]|uniref:hypothetical protein n=1 Tax=uncultured Phycicoccus sp. TaxID=661422 RepID=UPI00262A41EF|nr:hypothetical protein [uncultured Phycicoccus sp.]